MSHGYRRKNLINQKGIRCELSQKDQKVALLSEPSGYLETNWMKMIKLLEKKEGLVAQSYSQQEGID